MKYLTISNAITDFKGKKRYNEIYMYALIMNEIKSSSLQASISEAELADILGVTERTVQSYVADLKQTQLITDVFKKQGQSKYPYNVYQFPLLKGDFFFLYPQFLYDPNLTIRQKSLLMLLRTQCHAGSNCITFRTLSEVAKALSITKKSFLTDIDFLSKDGHIKVTDNALFITNPYMPTTIHPCRHDEIYESISRHCMKLGKVPPFYTGRAEDNPVLRRLVAHFPETNEDLIKSKKQGIDSDLLLSRCIDYQLIKKCPTLPSNLSLEYFLKALTNTQIKHESPDIISFLMS